MSLLHFTDILKKAGLDPAKVKLIRHSLGDKDFSKCYYSEPQMVWEYTRIQKPGFSKGYDYWCVFVSGEGTTARLFACYKVNGLQVKVIILSFKAPLKGEAYRLQIRCG